MTLQVGEWVLLHDGRAARIARLAVGPAGKMIEAETVDGQMVDRPESYATARWRPIAEDGLAVRLALDPEGVRSDVASKPVEVVVAALRDIGEEVSQAELREVLIRRVIPREDFAAWWKRVQPQLSWDERVDAGLARTRRYRLLMPGEIQTIRVVPRVSEELRNGRKLLDAPQLKGARERASSDPSKASDEARPEAALAQREDVDPTDRFMAAELGVWIGLWDADRGRDMLGSDLPCVDLMRISQHKSRSTALEWYATWLAGLGEAFAAADASAILRSAAALGPPWTVTAGQIGLRLGIDPSKLLEASLTWSMPGSPEAGQVKLPADLDTYDRRIERIRAAVAAGNQEEMPGLARGAVAALREFPLVESANSGVAQTLRGLAKCWLFARQAAPSPLKYVSDLAGLPARSMTAALGLIPDAMVEALRPAVEQAYVLDPQAYREPVEVFAARRKTDPGAIALKAARRAVRESKALELAAQALELAEEEVVRVESANLAVAVNPDDLQALGVLNEAADGVSELLLDGVVDSSATVLFSPSSWRRFAMSMVGELERAKRAEDLATAKVAELAVEVERLSALDEQRRAALTEVRAEVGAQGRASASAVAAGALRPVAAALADSFEANSLDALRDRLEGVILRAGISIVIQAGEVVGFDPTRQRWVGEGEPPDRVLALSPALVIRGEGNEETVVVPARVVAAR
jgi:hypothetical protein